MLFTAQEAIFCCYDCNHRFASICEWPSDYGVWTLYAPDGARVIKASEPPCEPLVIECLNLINSTPEFKTILDKYSGYLTCLEQTVIPITFDPSSSCHGFHSSPRCTNCNSIRTILVEGKRIKRDVEIWIPTFSAWNRMSGTDKRARMAEEIALYGTKFLTDWSDPFVKSSKG